MIVLVLIALAFIAGDWLGSWRENRRAKLMFDLGRRP